MELTWLSEHPALRSCDPGEVQEWLEPVFSIRSIDMPDGGRQFDTLLNHCALPSLSLTYATYGTPFMAHFTQNNFFFQGFPVTGSGEARWRQHRAIVDPWNGGIVSGPGSDMVFNYSPTFAHVILKIAPEALSRKLAALIGQPIDPPLEIVSQRHSNPALLAAQLRLLKFLAGELNQLDHRLPNAAIAELEEAVLVTYLMANESNYSKWLQGPPRAAAPWQVRRAVDYIEANWDQPITIEALTQAAQSTARSLFYLFKKTHGITPMTYVNRVRLRHARTMLAVPTPGTTVTAVAFACGFSNLGHFANRYRQAFGENPSDTLRSHW